MRDMLNLVAPDPVSLPPCKHIVQNMAVRARDNCGVIRRFCPAFNFEAVDARIRQLLHMVDHAHVARVHDVRALLVFKDGEVFSRALFLHQRILIPARLGALSAVRVAPGHIVGKKASAGIRHAHRAVAEGFQLQLRRDLFANGDDLSKAQLPRQHDPRRAEVKPALRADVIRNRLLGGDVPLAVRRVFSSQRECAEVCQNQCVRACRVELLKPRGKRGCLIVARHGIDRHMHAHTVLVGKRDCLRQLLRRKISGERAHTEACTRQIDRICAV